VVHHHHYKTENTTHQISYRIPRPPTHSALGTASLALGIIACTVCWVPWLGLVAVPVGAIGAVIGVIGLLVSLLFRRSSAGLPFAGIFVCCLAAGISIGSNRTLPYWQKQLNQVLATVMPKNLAPSLSILPATASPPKPPPSPPKDLFDFGSTPAAPAPSPTIAAKPTPVVAQPTPSHSAVVPRLDPAVLAARDQLAAAEKACDQRTMQTPEYQAAVNAAADAKTHEAELRDTTTNAIDLAQAGKDMIQAANAVSDMRTRAQSADPTVLAARQALAAARSGTSGH
jgi:hypothetical protein